MKNFFCGLFVLSCFCAVAQDRTAGGHHRLHREYHVSVNGNDRNAGTAASPFKTIMAAAAKALPGDVVTVHAGIYREAVTPPRGGNSEQERIVYQAAAGEKVVIKGAEVIKGWKRLEHDTWVVRIPNSFFGTFNPYREYIRGDWFWPTPKDRKYLRGAVYLNGDWLMEAAKKEDALRPAEAKDPLWWAVAEADSTTIWAQFKNADPNAELVEINVRPYVFYPDKPFMNFITVRGFTMEQAATNWAPPTAEQMGLIGTHWSRGWVIEHNTVRYSKCVGISLGKYGDAHDNNQTESAEGYVGTIKRALAFGWNKSTIGGHLVRNNTITHCEQTGIVGSMGCAYSIVEGNTIHDIYIRRQFSGAEQAAIKFHGAVDVQIRNNHIYRSNFGIWLDWMAQGAQIKSNLMHDNDEDIFLEVNHGPMLVSNNILLSKTSFLMNSGGAAIAHNIIGGKIRVISYDSRLTPYHPAHVTDLAGLHDNPGGDMQFVNNLFVNQGNAAEYSKALLPVTFAGNVYTKGTVRAVSADKTLRLGEMNAGGKEKMKQYKEQAATELQALVKNEFDAAARLITRDDGVYLSVSLDKNWLKEQPRKLVTTQLLRPAVVPQLPFDNSDGTPLKIDTDYSGNRRNAANPSPGPFEIKNSGKLEIKVK